MRTASMPMSYEDRYDLNKRWLDSLIKSASQKQEFTDLEAQDAIEGRTRFIRQSVKRSKGG